MPITESTKEIRNIKDYHFWCKDGVQVRYYFLSGVLYVVRGSNFWRALRTIRTSEKNVIVLKSVSDIKKVVFTKLGVRVYYTRFGDQGTVIHKLKRIWHD